MTIYEAYHLGLVVQMYDQIGCGCSQYNSNDGCCYGDCRYTSQPYYVPSEGNMDNKVLVELCMVANDGHWPIS